MKINDDGQGPSSLQFIHVSNVTILAFFCFNRWFHKNVSDRRSELRGMLERKYSNLIQEISDRWEYHSVWSCDSNLWLFGSLFLWQVSMDSIPSKPLIRWNWIASRFSKATDQWASIHPYRKQLLPDSLTQKWWSASMRDEPTFRLRPATRISTN